MEAPAIDLSAIARGSGPTLAGARSGAAAHVHGSGLVSAPHVETCTGGAGVSLTPRTAGEVTSSSPPARCRSAYRGGRDHESPTAPIDERPLGLWAAADVHRRAFGWRSGGRILSVITLLTPSWRVEHPHAVATLVARDPVSLSTWAIRRPSLTVGCPVGRARLRVPRLDPSRSSWSRSCWWRRSRSQRGCSSASARGVRLRAGAGRWWCPTWLSTRRAAATAPPSWPPSSASPTKSGETSC